MSGFKCQATVLQAMGFFDESEMDCCQFFWVAVFCQNSCETICFTAILFMMGA